MSIFRGKKDIFSKLLILSICSFILFPLNTFSIAKPVPDPSDVEINVQSTTPSSLKGATPVEEHEIKILGVREISNINGGNVPRTPPAPTVKQNSINFLFNSQNQDGSWGTNDATRFITTAAVLKALQANNISGSELDKGIEWLSYYFVDNTDFLAEKLFVTIQAGEPETSAEVLLNNFDEASGGFTVDGSYQADPLTTAKAIQTLIFADYKDQGTSPNLTITKALKYLIEKKNVDNGWGAFEKGVSTLEVTSEAIEALLLWKHRSFTVNNESIAIDDTLNPAINALKNKQLPNGSWNNNALQTSLAYHAIRAAKETALYEDQVITYLEDEQSNDGSFGSDIYRSAKVLSASSVSNPTYLVIEDLTPTSIVQTGVTSTFNLRISNKGNVALDSGILHTVIDNYLYQSIDLGANNVMINAGGTVDVSLGINNTRGFIGDVSFKFFIEGANSEIYPDSFFKKTITYASDPALRPGLPVYFVAYKGISTSGTPAITWRWPIKGIIQLLGTRN